MLVRKISSAVIGAGFLAAMMATPVMAADVSISGEVDMHLWQYSSPSSSEGTGIGVDGAGSSDSYSHMYSQFDEAELKFKTKGKTANGWKVGTEVELEIGQGGKNDFELEEASAYVDFGAVKLIGGILEDWGSESGAAAELVNVEDPKMKSADEAPGFRIAVGSIENLDLDIKLRFQAKDVEDDVDGDGDDDEFGVSRNETRIQAKYDFGMGYARFIYGSLSDKAVDSDAAGDYAYSESLMDILVGLEFGQIAPFFEMLNMTTKETAALDGSDESESKFTQMTLGADFALSKELTLTGAYMTQELDVDGASEKNKLTEMNLGAAYKVKPVEFTACYFAASNNYSDFGGEDAKESGFKFGMKTKF